MPRAVDDLDGVAAVAETRRPRLRQPEPVARGDGRVEHEELFDVRVAREHDRVGAARGVAVANEVAVDRALTTAGIESMDAQRSCLARHREEHRLASRARQLERQVRRRPRRASLARRGLETEAARDGYHGARLAHHRRGRWHVGELVARRRGRAPQARRHEHERRDCAPRVPRKSVQHFMRLPEVSRTVIGRLAEQTRIKTGRREARERRPMTAPGRCEGRTRWRPRARGRRCPTGCLRTRPTQWSW